MLTSILNIASVSQGWELRNSKLNTVRFRDAGEGRQWENYLANRKADISNSSPENIDQILRLFDTFPTERGANQVSRRYVLVNSCGRYEVTRSSSGSCTSSSVYRWR